MYLEGARKLKAIALDETGTITEVKPQLVEWQLLEHAPDAGVAAKTAESAAAILAGASDHPVSRAISAGLRPSSFQVKDFKAMAGRGVQTQIDSQLWVLGNHRWIKERDPSSPALGATLNAHEAADRTVSVLACDAAPVAWFAVAYTIKPSSRQAVTELQALGITPVMLTGDNQATATNIAQQAGISEARGNLLPQNKLDAIKALQARHGVTAMTGDGINDAPALAQADISVAMGAAGTDTAMEAADLVVMNDDLRRIAETVRLSRTTHAVLWQNIALALGIKAVFLCWRCLATPACGWRYLPTWAPACWWWPTGFVCCGQKRRPADLKAGTGRVAKRVANEQMNG